MRLGLFGGSFDPVHRGHLQLARSCQQQARLDQVWFIPAATQPLKQQGAHATDDQRLAMLELAVASEPSWQVSRLELDRGGISYTADTLRRVHELHPKAELFFLLGADSLRDFSAWRDPEAILRLATLLVVSRAGEEPPDFDRLQWYCPGERLASIRDAQVDMPAMEIASRTIRERIARGEDVSGQVPAGVGAYIQDQRLYRN